MSSWWEIKFCATGEFSKLADLENELPSLFHQLFCMDRAGGILIAQVAENYGGGTAMDATIGRYPDLTFNGVMIHETAQEDDSYYAFAGVDGEPEWRKFSIPEDELIMTPDAIENEITQINQKIAYLSERRAWYSDQQRRIEGGTEKSGDLTDEHRIEDTTLNRDQASEEISEMLAKIKSRHQ